MLRSFATVGLYTGLSRILGFIRDILIAQVVGAGPVADAFFVAFRLPNMFRRLFGEGAFNAAFVPLFARRLEEDGEDAARRFAADAQAVLFSFLMVLTLVVLATMPWVMLVLAPGFRDSPDQFDLAVALSRITFPYLVFIALTALLSGLLNSLGRFAAAAAAPVLLNVLFIAALLVLVPDGDAGDGTRAGPERAGYVMAWTVAAAGLAQFLMLAVAARRAGMFLGPVRPRVTPALKRLWALMVPGLLSAGALQINMVVGTIIATLEAGAVSYLYYADRVYQLPLGMIGIALGIVLLPALTRKIRSGQDAAALAQLNRGIEAGLFLTLPAAAALMVIPWPIVTVLFERGLFEAADGRATALALAVYAAGLPAYVLNKLLQPAFFAREDTMTPFKVSLLMVIANIALSLALFFQMGFVGLALATSLSAWLGTLVLALFLVRRGFFQPDRRLGSRCLRMAGASAVMAAGLWAVAQFLHDRFGGPEIERIAALAGLVAVGLLLYGLGAFLLRAIEPAELKALFRRGPAA
jgi:putative peptidoglycan lipid II flippase